MPDIGLKPCPFCGGKAVADCKYSSSKHGDIGFVFTVECKSCKITLSKDFKIELHLASNGDIVFSKDERQEAIEAWNRRADDERI